MAPRPVGLARELIRANDTRLHRSLDHRRDFLDAVKTRRPTVAPAEEAHRALSVALLGEISMLTGRTLRWRPDLEAFEDDPGATALLGRAYREPWSL